MACLGVEMSRTKEVGLRQGGLIKSVDEHLPERRKVNMIKSGFQKVSCITGSVFRKHNLDRLRQIVRENAFTKTVINKEF